MGNKPSSNSKTNIKNRQDITNEDILSVTNETLTDIAVKAIMKDAQSCSATSSTANVFSMRHGKVDGNFNLNAKQSTQAAVSLDCVQASRVKTEMMNDATNTIMNKIKSEMGADAFADAKAAAESAAEKGSLSLPFGGAESSSESDSENELIVTNRTDNSFHDVVDTIISNTFENESIKDCSSNIKNSNIVDVDFLRVGGDANIVLDQSAITEAITTCLQESDAMNTASTTLARNLGLTQDTTKKSETTTKAESTSTSSSKDTSIVSEMGDAVGGVIGSVLGPLSALFSGNAGLVLAAICGIVCLVGLYLLLGGNNTENKDGGQQQQQNPMQQFQANLNQLGQLKM